MVNKLHTHSYSLQTSVIRTRLSLCVFMGTSTQPNFTHVGKRPKRWARVFDIFTGVFKRHFACTLPSFFLCLSLFTIRLKLIQSLIFTHFQSIKCEKILLYCYLNTQNCFAACADYQLSPNIKQIYCCAAVIVATVLAFTFCPIWATFFSVHLCVCVFLFLIYSFGLVSTQQIWTAR